MEQTDFEALYREAIEVEVRDHAVGRILVALIRHMGGFQSLDTALVDNEAADVAAHVTQTPPDEVRENAPVDAATHPGGVQADEQPVVEEHATLVVDAPVVEEGDTDHAN